MFVNQEGTYAVGYGAVGASQQVMLIDLQDGSTVVEFETDIGPCAVGQVMACMSETGQITTWNLTGDKIATFTLDGADMAVVGDRVITVNLDEGTVGYTAEGQKVWQASELTGSSVIPVWPFVTVHSAVVDPGTGTILRQGDEFSFVGGFQGTTQSALISAQGSYGFVDGVEVITHPGSMTPLLNGFAGQAPGTQGTSWVLYDNSGGTAGELTRQEPFTPQLRCGTTTLVSSSEDLDAYSAMSDSGEELWRFSVPENLPNSRLEPLGCIDDDAFVLRVAYGGLVTVDIPSGTLRSKLDMVGRQYEWTLPQGWLVQNLASPDTLSLVDTSGSASATALVPESPEPDKANAVADKNSVTIQHPTWGQVTVSVTGEPDPTAYTPYLVQVTDPSGNVLWERAEYDIGGYGWELNSPATDDTGNVFIMYNPGRVNGVIVLRPVPGGMDDLGTAEPQDDYLKRFYSANAVDIDGDGTLEIQQSSNDCNPTCGEGTTTETIFHWDGSDYSPN